LLAGEISWRVSSVLVDTCDKAIVRSLLFILVTAVLTF
jgi:hypothetical protein